MKKIMIIVISILMLILLSFSVSASYDAFLQVNGVDGGSVDSKHAGWINVESYGHKMYVTPGAKTATHDTFNVVKELDKATPKLSQYVCSGTIIPTVILELATSTGNKDVFMKYTLKNVVVSSIAPAGIVSEDMPNEEVAFDYESIEWEYSPLGTGGSATSTIKAGWNVNTNSAIN
ncbi:MAG: type VI secretion system tube protein Hcp [archaeon]|nr:type VI secretion system tube protein Hcp [Nanoarchaeota archaeon]